MSLTPLTPDEVRAFRADFKLTQGGLAEALGLSRRTIEEWEAGRNPCPAWLGLALAAMVSGLPPWRPGAAPKPTTQKAPANTAPKPKPIVSRLNGEWKAP